MRLGQPAHCCVNGEAAISNYCSGSKIRGISVVVIPAPAGIYPRNKRRPARLPGNCRPLDKRSASFEASLREAPQDEEFSFMRSVTSLMLRSVRQGASRSKYSRDAADFLTASCTGLTSKECCGFLINHSSGRTGLTGNRLLTLRVGRLEQEPRYGVVMLGTILLIILILILIGSLPTWPYSGSWGYYPSGGFGLLVVIVIVLLLMGRI